ncbi:hypothetical protein NDU88_004353 [Pleurodeles waltl]|uniref:t-SNARE coiled-coil homology domain-containing protein n=1 Tax=Pleurodeles waltl TaxID=8319 RepID=A0AAV7WA40_PLEWA|nr:hypothetical protein NDU88_004353 [Pleurodeles waltl]
MAQHSGAGDEETAPQDEVEPTRVDLLVALQGCGTALEQNLETLSIDVSLLRVDLGKVADKVTTVEGNIADMQGEMVALNYDNQGAGVEGKGCRGPILM